MKGLFGGSQRLRSWYGIRVSESVLTTRTPISLCLQVPREFSGSTSGRGVETNAAGGPDLPKGNSRGRD